MEKQTTPTPWRVATKDEFYLAASDYNSVVAGKGYGGDGFTLTGWINKNDAELIVKAVNSHAKLVEFLKDVHKLSKYKPDHDTILYDFKEIHTKATGLLKHLESNPLK